MRERTAAIAKIVVSSQFSVPCRWFLVMGYGKRLDGFAAIAITKQLSANMEFMLHS
ncbi:MAG: hypothetical protein K8L97_28150 [Anaerolineae bacterium]|nr:hypothetical protein [Anaerolineae bacterium]